MPLNHDVHELLLILERAQGMQEEWVHIAALRHLSESAIECAVRENWVKQKGFGNLRQFKILAAGYSTLGDNAEWTIKQLRGENVESLDTRDPEPSSRGLIRSLIQPLGEPVVIHVDDPTPVEPEISVSVYSETLGTEPDAPVGTRHAVPLSANGVKTCCEPGCNQPRYLSYNRCKPHQRQLWRNRQANQRDTDRPGRKRRPLREVQPRMSFDEPPIADDDTQPDIIPITDTPPRCATGPDTLGRPRRRPLPVDREGWLLK